jgi:hypothetical protein
VNSYRTATVIALLLCIYVIFNTLCQGCIYSFIYTVSRLYWAGN